MNWAGWLAGGWAQVRTDGIVRLDEGKRKDSTDSQPVVEMDRFSHCPPAR